MSLPDSPNLDRLRRYLCNAFSDEELRTLSFDLNADPDEISGRDRPKDTFSRELLLWFIRRNKLCVLLGKVMTERPSDWLEDQIFRYCYGQMIAVSRSICRMLAAIWGVDDEDISLYGWSDKPNRAFVLSVEGSTDFLKNFKPFQGININGYRILFLEINFPENHIDRGVAYCLAKYHAAPQFLPIS